MSVADYLELLDWTARQMRSGKPNVIDWTRSPTRGQRYHVRTQARQLLAT